MLSARLAVVAVVVLAACGDDGADPRAEVELGVASVVAERLDAEPGEVGVACGADGFEPGDELVCTVSVAPGEPVDVALAVVEGGTVELREAVIPTAAAEDYLAEKLAVNAAGAVDADCGEDALVVAPVGGEFRCGVVRPADGAAHTVVVTVLDLDGTVRYRVEPAGGAPGPPAGP